MLIVTGKRRKGVGYADEAQRYDESGLRVLAGNILRRLQLAAVGCCTVLSTFVWLRAEEWTVPGAQLGYASGARPRR